MSALRGAVAALLVLGAAGCAPRADWIEGTLVTVDVTGVWRGTVTSRFNQGDMEMVLTQRGARVTGDGRIRATRFGIEGTVRGDALSFSAPGGRVQAVATVSGDEMAGEGRGAGTGFPQFTLKLSRQPEGQSR